MPCYCWGAEQILEPISSDNLRIEYTGYVRKEIVAAPDNPDYKLVRFDRVLDMPNTGYRWDNPGVSIRFRTDATVVNAILYYNDRHISKRARNSIGVWSVDGVFKPNWIFQTRQQSVQRGPETITAVLACDEAKGFHDYAIFLPYGDSVDFAGLKVSPGARFETPKPAPALRYIAYGDSITHGFTASQIDKTYPFLVGQKRGWQTIDLGLGGRSSGASPSDVGVIASLKPDILTVLMGVNDWQAGVPLERYRANMQKFLGIFRAAQSDTPVYLITPLWVTPTWNPPGHKADLEQYRQVLRDVVTTMKDPNLHVIEGASLIDHDPSLFSPVAVHPNDAGFAEMEERLDRQLSIFKNQR